MKKFTDLLLFEINRIKKAYFLLMGAIILLQVTSVVVTTNNYMNVFKNYQKEKMGNLFEFLENWPKFGFFQVQNHVLFEFSILLGILALLVYTFVIWYRDWIGKNNLSYRLLAIPGSRMSVFYAKFACILLLMGGLLAMQVIMLYVGEMLTRLIIPSEMFEATQLLGHTSKGEIVSYVLPARVLDFIFHYTMGMTVLVIAKLFIILHLSFKWRGVAIGLALGGILIFMFTAFMLSDIVLYIFPMETLVLMLVLSILISSASLVAIRYLMKNKISV